MPGGQLCLGFVPGPESNNNCFVEIFSEGTMIGSVLSRVGTIGECTPPPSNNVARVQFWTQLHYFDVAYD